MELNYIITIIDRKKMEQISKIYDAIGVQLGHSLLCHGSSKSSIIDKYGVEATDKGIVYGIGDGDTTRNYIKEAIEKLMLDVPGNGLVITVPIKSVKGGRTVAYLTNNHTQTKKKEAHLKFNYEMIVVILNEGYTDAVMSCARSAGATGGTVIHAKGTGVKNAEKFFGVSLANEREIIYIVTDSETKGNIMNAIDEKCGVSSEAGAICFSLPVSNVIGFRNIKNSFIQ